MTQQHKDRDAVWALIPWYVNGTLSIDERALVERHAAQCDALAAEIADQRRLASSIAAIDTDAHRADAAWKVLRTRIAPRKRAWPTLRLVPAGIAMAAGLAAVAVFVGPMLGPQQGADTFQTLTTDASDGTAMLRIRAVPGSDPDAVLRVLLAEGIREPLAISATGLITAAVPADTDAKALAERLQSAPQIAFVAGDF